MNCRFCNKQYNDTNSLKNHELRCKLNKDRLITPKPKYSIPPSTKGRIWISNSNKNKLVFPEDFEIKYKKEGWSLGMNEEYKKKIKGKALTPEKEEERKNKISKSMKNNPNSGGYRKGSGRGKKGWYCNIFCDSTWELAFVYYHISNNLNIQRCKEKRFYTFNNSTHVYYPDFETDNGIFEIKGYVTEQSKSKSQQNPDIKVLYYNDMKFYLDYVINIFGKDFYKKLYKKEG